MSIEDKQSSIMELFESKRDELSQTTIFQVEEAFDLWNELYENDVENQVLGDLLDEIEDMIEVDHLG